MIVRTLLAALVAGIIAGAAVTPLQHWTTVPLILEAETFENGTPHEHAAHAHPVLTLATPAQAHGIAAPEAGEEAGGTTRTAGSLLANLVIGAGFALLLTAASLATNRPLSARNGALWGLLGFGVFTLAPGFGLSPELPAMPAADLQARQLWWLMTVCLTASGLALVLLREGIGARAAGVALIVLPHLVPAPHPADIASPIPATLAAEFVMASLMAAGVFWVLTGFLAGILNERFAAARPAVVGRAA